MAESPAAKWSGHALWLVGFRPFFALAIVSATTLPLLWALVYSGTVAAPAARFSVVQWHAHEMFYGFGFAVLGGFLLTATKNWVSVRGWYGRPLQFLVLTWLVERAAMWFGGAWPRPLFLLSSSLFLASLVVMLAWTLLRHRATDSYRDNAIFLVVLPAFLIARTLLLGADSFAAGRDMTIALFRMAFLVMLERTLTPFMKGAFQVTLPRVAVVDGGIKLTGLLLVAAPWLPGPLRAGLSFVLAAVLAGRFLVWKPHLAFQKLDVAVMYLGGFAISAQLVLDGVAALRPIAWVGAVSVHVFTLGTMGLIIPAMITRISKGHTGRPVKFDGFDQAALWLMIAAFLLRVVPPQLAPQHYLAWVWAAAACWSAGFAVVGLRAMPLLFRPRVDGREH